ncbi:pyruvate formate lyase-activating protein [Nodosilinea sp. LEGE 07088]|uniref:pyruvate formate-lyase-activating protein n=1 Tax=Nodosilinea sp. LEGE 07088 TaxID=2777968 RepID=UPI00187E5A98|nr:pyruvate formate-lyase-activating protein [Nodosilinea sp. LEGE 07088]MBE9141241.1 pyruvate formate lyase-activating protein [Nodosilinea sp. LEGE 07088]
MPFPTAPHPPHPNLSSASKGRIHSVEPSSTVDGPGIRYVIFTQGCLLRCQYCHNPDTRDPLGGEEVTIDALIDDIQHYQSYFTYSGGGVTITGGEPLLQPEFVREVFRRCQELGIHTALDTSGFPDFERSKPVLDYVDLVLLDIKSFDSEIYHRATHVDLAPTLQFARHLSAIAKPTWVRFVLVPGLTDDSANIKGLAQFVATLQGVEKVEVLPFHKMGEYKWKELGFPYLLENTDPPTPEQIESAKAIFRHYGLRVD